MSYFPITLATAVSESLWRTAESEVATSGSDVPMETIVSPMINYKIPKIPAISTAESTIHRDPNTIKANPIKRMSTFFE
ncbi:MAG: hypothetical protein U5K35_07735 [Rhodohalobacter sp.]|nr:hypothetical protein [Rhodohalobacter sp.]MDZ7756283.1 hypothetical protein [Rhodohalobacter sp.]